MKINIGAEFRKENVKSLWNESESALPNTSELYAIDVEKLPELFKKLAKEEF